MVQTLFENSMSNVCVQDYSKKFKWVMLWSEIELVIYGLGLFSDLDESIF